MPTKGSKNGLTDVDGILLGHFTDRKAASGVTVILCLDGATAGVDVRGSAPGTRETDLLAPTCLVEKVQAVVLSGGSVYGLAAADGVVAWLAEKGHGFPVDEKHVAPIVPAAVLFDLGRGPDFIPPISAQWGRDACESANNGPVSMGCVGAGTGAMSGTLKGGLGSASMVLDSGITVGAVVAVNSLGMVLNPKTGRFWELGLEMEDEFGDAGRRKVKPPPPAEAAVAQNTTLAVVATDAELTKAQAQKVAQMAHDGMGRAIRPAHTMFDGDTIYCMATGDRNITEEKGFFLVPQAQALTDIGHAAADCLSRAIIHAILAAESMAGLTAFRDLEAV
jgi:L-aminopeptidase/D-esterase-like protein